MIRTELREHIFKLLFQEEFNREEDMQEHLKYYFMTLENAADKDKDYIQEKYEAVAGHIAEIDELINQYAKGSSVLQILKEISHPLQTQTMFSMQSRQDWKCGRYSGISMEVLIHMMRLMKY